MPDLRYAEAVRRQRAAIEAAQAEDEAKTAVREAWRTGHLQPFIITQVLDMRGLYGPGVDEACGVREPAVDQWEAGILYPSYEQVLALAMLTATTPAFLVTPHEPIGFEDTSMRFHLRKRDKRPPPLVRCFLPEAIHAATGTTSCPYCGLEYRPGVPTVLRCPLCRSEQNGRTVIDGGIATCPDCDGTWLAGDDDG